MLTVSQQIKDTFRASGRKIESNVVIAGVEYGPEQIVEWSLRDSIQDSSAFTLGTAISSELILSLRTTNVIPTNAKVQLYLLAATEEIQFGEYYIERRKQAGTAWEYTCCDAMMLAEQPYISQLTYPVTMAAVLAEACSLAGIVSDITVPEGLMFVVAPTGYSCRGVIRLVASAMAGSARIKKNGHLGFMTFASLEPVETIGLNEYQKLVHTNPVKTISRVVCKLADDTLEAGTGSEDNAVTIDNPYLIQANVNAIQAALNEYAYQPFTASWIVLPWVEVGDRIDIVEYVPGSRTETQIVTTTVMTSTIRYHGGLGGTISASSDSQQQSEFKPVGTISDQINRINREAVRLGGSYYGFTVTKEGGAIIERQDGASKAVFNSDELKFQALNELGELVDRIYFDPVLGKYVFDGELSVGTLEAIKAN
ncbi:MAG: hypothetical protein ACYDG2_01245, partial [Ruminiclostridium sp.]